MGLAIPSRGAGAMPSFAVHPDARSGAGGPGYFRDANAFLYDDEPWRTIRHRRSPAARLVLAQAGGPSSGTSGNTGAAASGAGVKPKPPPKTKTLKQRIAHQAGPEVDIEVYVRVEADRHDVKSVGAHGAHTRADPVGGVKRYAGMGNLRFDDDGKLVSVGRKLTIKGYYRIQTSYGRKAKPTDISVYGRGTTPKDKADGNVTLGFHEWCHQQEYVDYFTSTPFPVFEGKLGMTREEIQEAARRFNDAFDAYNQAMSNLGAAVDEVGYTLSQCKADGNCK